MQAVSAKVAKPSLPQNHLVLSSKLKEENISAVLNSPTSTPCVNGCGFYGTPEQYGYCTTCFKLVHESASQIDLASLADESGGNNNNEPAVVPAPAPADPPKQVVAEKPAEVTTNPPTKTEKKPKRRKSKTKPKEPEKDVDDDGSLSSGEEALMKSADSFEEPDGFLEVSSHSRHSKFTVMEGDQVEKLMARKIRDASELLGLSDDESALVLMFFSWNVGRLQEQYFLNVDKVFLSCENASLFCLKQKSSTACWLELTSESETLTPKRFLVATAAFATMQ